MKKAIQTKRVWIGAAAAVLALTLVWYFYGRESGQVRIAGPSHYETVQEGYTAWTAQEQYPAGTASITVSVRNDGAEAHELDHPVLELQRDGVWYSLQREEGATTSNLLGVAPGQTKDFDLWTPPYGTLSPGRYRVLFRVWERFDYIAAEFDVV